MENHNENFEKIKAQLHEQGFHEKDVTITSGKAMISGVFYALPFAIVIGLIYRFLLVERACLLEVSGLSFYIIFIAIIAISVVIHELLHGIGWAAASGKGWHVVRFHINAMMPCCACKAALEKNSYLFGVFFIFIYPGTVSFLTMIVNFISAGADLMIACNVLKEKGDVLIADHPKEPGYIAFYR